jgi:hypothetical protein
MNVTNRAANVHVVIVLVFMVGIEDEEERKEKGENENEKFERHVMGEVRDLGRRLYT